MGDEREGLQGWETRDAGSGLSYIERGTGKNTERFLAVPLLYDEAGKVEDLIARVGQLTQELQDAQGQVLKDVLWLIDCERDAAQTTGGELDAIENIERRVRGHFHLSTSKEKAARG